MLVKDLPIRKKLIVIIMTVCVLTLAATTSVIFLYNISEIKQSMTREMTTLARLLANRTTAALAFGDERLAQENLQALHESPHVSLACVFNADGDLLAEYRVAQLTREACPSRISFSNPAAYFSKKYLHVEQEIRLNNRQVGFISIQTSLQGINDRIYDAFVVLLLVLLAAGLLAYLLSRRLQKIISKPLAEVAATASSIESRRDYSIRAPRYGDDEIGRLSDSFNAMLGTIEAKDADLVAARDHLEEQVSQRTRALANANEELEAFSYSVSHDLRAPLRSINGFSQAILEEDGEYMTDQCREWFDRIRSSSMQMDNLIDGLLTLSRISRAEIALEEINLSIIANELVAEYRERDPLRDVRVDIQPQLPAFADKGLMRAALDNLLGNAWKYTSKTGDAAITFGSKRSEGTVVYFVRDNGAGFDMNYAHKLFGAFQRLHLKSEFDGNGIGLATTKRIIHRHHGRIWGEGEPDKGATFIFTIGDTTDRS